MEVKNYKLLLNEDVLKQTSEQKKPIYIFEWLQYLDKELLIANKTDIKSCQKELVQQLTAQIQNSPGPPTRKLIANCLAILFSVGDTFLLFDTVNTCNDILKNKDDSPSFLLTKLAAICVLGSMYEKLGRMMGRSYEETVQILIKVLKNAESQTRIEIMTTLEKVCTGMNSAITNVHKDIYKATKHCLTDRVMAVRVAAAKCILEMLNHAFFLYGTELENVATLCYRAFDSSNYEVRCAVSKLLGTLLSLTQQQVDEKKPMQQAQSKLTRSISLDEAFGILMSGFLRGGASGIIKGTGEIIKGSSSVNREIRVGITHSYVVFIQNMGSVWLEKNLQVFLIHVLDLVANPKAATSHVDAVYSRKCINFILRSIIGKMLGEKAQASACKELIHIVAKQMNSIDFNPENAKDSNQETLFQQHLLVCALTELGILCVRLGTTAQNLLSDVSLNFIDTICAVLIHPCSSARLGAAWCLRCICIAIPNEITPLIDRFIDAIDQMRSSPEAISGYSCALAAILGSVKFSPLGIPHTKGKFVFNTAEELLRSASQNSRLSLSRTQAGWLLIGSIMTLGSSVVRNLLPRMLLLWRNSFPRSAKELESEKARGDSFTWQVTLEGRAGALSVLHSFLLNCDDLVTEDITRRLLTPIESAMAMLINIPSVLKNYGPHLKAPIAMVRLRLYETLSLLPPSTFESSYTHLLRMLVAEFSLSDNPANTTNSILRSLCHGNDSIILGKSFQETNHRIIEDQLQPNSAAGSGALEHDTCSLYRPTNNECPGPLPLGIAVIDQSIILFGLIFPRVANKHRLQMLEHFAECIKQAKSSRQEAIQINILTAFLSGLKSLNETKSKIGHDDIKTNATSLILSSIVHPNPILRYAGAEALGRIAQVVVDSRFTAELSQNGFDKLKLARDVVTRTGYSLALGCLHRHFVGTLWSSQQLNTSVSILLALAQDTTSPVVVVWSLYSLSLIASGGPMFRGSEATLNLCLKLLLTMPQSNVDVHQCIGRVLNALITTMGPELSTSSSKDSNEKTPPLFSQLMLATSLLESHSDSLVQAEATGCLQQLHLFAPKHVVISSLVQTLLQKLSSNYLILRKSAVSCLRQISQRQATEICEIALRLISEGSVGSMSDYGLPGVLFGMLNTETDPEIIKNIQDTLNGLAESLNGGLTLWLSLCKNVLTINLETSDDNNSKDLELHNDDDDGETADDVTEYHAKDVLTHSALTPRWTTRVFAAECVRKLILSCESINPMHFDLVQAKEQQMIKSNTDFLILHLSELIRMSFMAATSDSDQLRLEGLKTLQEIIAKFSHIPEPEFPGHLLLEQFQAQVGAALRPAFSAETPPHVTAAACEVCSVWVGSGVVRDINDLKRVHQLLVSSLSKLDIKTNSTQLFNESIATLEKLSILKAWAEIYIIAMMGNGSAPASFIQKKITPSALAGNVNFVENDDGDDFAEYESRSENLLSLVKPELTNLTQHWLAALKDYAILLLPSEYHSQLPHDGGAFYTTDTMHSSKPHYLNSWDSIVYAISLWLNDDGFEILLKETGCEKKNESNIENNNLITHGSLSADRFHMIFGICMEALCSARTNDKIITNCLKSIYTILNSDVGKKYLTDDKTLTIELCNILHRIILTKDCYLVQLLCIYCIRQTTKAMINSLNEEKSNKLKDIVDDDNKEDLIKKIDYLGEGGENGEIVPEKSYVYAVLEVCLCCFVRQIPSINPHTSGILATVHMKKEIAQRNSVGCVVLNEDSKLLITSGLECAENLLQLCSPKGAISVLPTILHLTTNIIKYIATKPINDQQITANYGCIQAALHCLKTICTDKYSKDERINNEWQKLLQSTLASIIDLTKTGSDDKKMDEITMMLAISIFIQSGFASIPSLRYPSINYFRQNLQNDNKLVRLKCIQTVKSIFNNAELKISSPYIHALAPRIITEGLYSNSANSPRNDADLSITLESIKTALTLVELVEPENRTQILSLLVPVLINYLQEPKNLQLQPKPMRQLHEQSLIYLMNIGPKYPPEFKYIVGQSVELRQKLETAIRHNQQKTSGKNMKTGTSSEDQKQGKSASNTIQLKTDFSNFLLH